MHSTVSFLEDAAEEYSGKTALMGAGRKTTYAELRAGARRFSEALQSGGVKPGARVVLSFTRETEFVQAYWGALLASAIPVLVSAAMPPSKLEYVINDSGAAAFVGAEAAFKALPEPPSSLKTALLICGGAGGPERGFQIEIPNSGVNVHRPDGGAPESPGEREGIPGFTCIYTSGTTGRPKGVMLSATNIRYGTRMIREFLALGPEDRSLPAMPFTHCAGLLHLLALLETGGAVVTGFAPALPGSFLNAVRDLKVTVLPVVPAMMTLLLSRYGRDLPERCRSLRVMEFSSAPLAPSLVREVRGLLPQVDLFNTYGLTEAPRITYARLESEEGDEDHVGRVNPELTVFIDRSANPSDKVGEVCAQGPNVAEGGYWNGSAGGDARFSSNGFRTGDLGWLDEENRLHLAGRSDDLFKVGGENVYPEEIERVISSMKGISDARIDAVEDPLLGTRIVARVVGCSPEVTAKAVSAYCLRHLERFKVPSRIDFVEEIPRTESGKHSRSRSRVDSDPCRFGGSNGNGSA